MKTPEHYQEDILSFFAGNPMELTLYEALVRRMERVFPEASIKVQKSQISFYGKHLFTAASLPVRRRKDWARNSILVTFGLAYRLESPRIAVSTEPYPNRWTHHVVVSDASQLDHELLGWLQEAYAFSENKRTRQG